MFPVLLIWSKNVGRIKNNTTNRLTCLFKFWFEFVGQRVVWFLSTFKALQVFENLKYHYQSNYYHFKEKKLK